MAHVDVGVDDAHVDVPRGVSSAGAFTRKIAVVQLHDLCGRTHVVQRVGSAGGKGLDPFDTLVPNQAVEELRRNLGVERVHEPVAANDLAASRADRLHDRRLERRELAFARLDRIGTRLQLLGHSGRIDRTSDDRPWEGREAGVRPAASR